MSIFKDFVAGLLHTDQNGVTPDHDGEQFEQGVKDKGCRGASIIDRLIDCAATTVSSDTAKRIGNNAFFGRSNLVEAKLPNVTYVGTTAFAGCYALVRADYPLATTVGQQAFYGCLKLAEVNLSKLWTVDKETFLQCYALRKLDFPRVNTIQASAFKGCRLLTALVLRSTTMCRLRGSGAFTGCLHMLGTVDATHNPDGLQDGYVYVPASLIASYQADSAWSAEGLQFRALEDYTVDGTVTGELDETKI